MKLILGDCLEKMKEIQDNSVDMVLCDLPYGTTGCKWDCVIPLEPLWREYQRIIKIGRAMVFTASQPFTSFLVTSKMDCFKYSWVWDKKIPSGMSYARFQPMRQHEDVLVFCFGRTPYNAQVTQRDTPIKKGGNKFSETAPIANCKTGASFSKTYTTKQPTTIIQFPKVRRGSVHPTQKPVELMEYLIKTYTKFGDTVLDNCMGSGTTGVACKRLGRNFIGIEKDENYFNIAKERIASADFRAVKEHNEIKGGGE